MQALMQTCKAKFASVESALTPTLSSVTTVVDAKAKILQKYTDSESCYKECTSAADTLCTSPTFKAPAGYSCDLKPGGIRRPCEDQLCCGWLKKNAVIVKSQCQSKTVTRANYLPLDISQNIKAFQLGQSLIVDAEAHTFECVSQLDLAGFTKVRHLPDGATQWHQAKDLLTGVEVYGDSSNDSVTWSIAFNNLVFESFLFVSGDKTMWL